MKGIFRDIKYLSTSGEGKEAASIGCVAGVPGMVERDKLINKDWNTDPEKTQGEHNGQGDILIPGDVTSEYQEGAQICIQDMNGATYKYECAQCKYSDGHTRINFVYGDGAVPMSGIVWIWRADWAPIEEHEWWAIDGVIPISGDEESSYGEFFVAVITREQYIYIDQAGVERGDIVLEGDVASNYIAGTDMVGVIGMGHTPIVATIASVSYNPGTDQTTIALSGGIVSEWEAGAPIWLWASKTYPALQFGDRVTFSGPWLDDITGQITYSHETVLVFTGIMTDYKVEGYAYAYFMDIDGNMRRGGGYKPTEGHVIRMIHAVDNRRTRGSEILRMEYPGGARLIYNDNDEIALNRMKDDGSRGGLIPVGTLVKLSLGDDPESPEWVVAARTTGTDMEVEGRWGHVLDNVMALRLGGSSLWNDARDGLFNIEQAQEIPVIPSLTLLGTDVCAKYRDGDILNKLSLSIAPTPSSAKRSIACIEDTFAPAMYGNIADMGDIVLGVECDLSMITEEGSTGYASQIYLFENMIAFNGAGTLPEHAPISTGDIIVVQTSIWEGGYCPASKIYLKCTGTPRIEDVNGADNLIIPVVKMRNYSGYSSYLDYHVVDMYPEGGDGTAPPAISAYEDLTGVTEKFFEGVTYVPRFSIYYDTVFTRTSERGLRTINSVKDIVDIYNQDSLMDPRTNLPMAAYLYALSSGMANKFKIYALDMRGVAEYGVMPNEYADELSSWANMPSQVLPHKDIYGVATMTFSKAVQDMLHAAFVNMSADKMAEKIYFVCRGIINGGDINTQAIDVFGSGQYGMDEYASDRKYSDGDGVVYYDPDADAEAAMSYPLPYNSERLVFVGCEFAGIGDINIEGYYVTAILLGQIMSKPLGYVMDGEGVPLLSRIPMRDTYYSEDDYYDLSISGWYMLEQTGTGPVTHYMGMTTAYSNRDKMELANVIAIDHFMRGIRATLAQYTKGGTENRVDNNGDGTLTKRYMERVSSAVKSVAQDYVNREIFESAALKTAEIDGTVSGRIKIGISISLYRQERYIYVTAYV